MCIQVTVLGVWGCPWYRWISTITIFWDPCDFFLFRVTFFLSFKAWDGWLGVPVRSNMSMVITLVVWYLRFQVVTGQQQVAMQYTYAALALLWADFIYWNLR